MDAPQWPKDGISLTNSTSSSSHLKQEKSKIAKPNKNQTLNCPRCNSTNTKFCYYNNYNPSQPRHLCKACRRYWTHGGTLRNVPVGGTSRKRINKPSLTNNFQPSHMNQDLNMGLYYANAQHHHHHHHHLLANPSLFELSLSQGGLSPYHNASSMSSLGFNFQDIVKPTLNLSRDGGFGGSDHDRNNMMEGGGRNPIYMFGEVKQASTTSGEANVINHDDGQMRQSQNGAVYWNHMHQGLYN